MVELTEIRSIIHRVVQQAPRGTLLPLLHEVQETFGYIAPEIVPIIAEALNVSRAEVHGAITFYPDFRTRPPSLHTIKLCRAESCQARGGAAIEQALSLRLGVAMGQTREDGHVALEPVYCLGMCAIGPNALVNERPVARIGSAAVESIALEVEA